MSANVWRSRSASETIVSEYHSPNTPTIMNSQPASAATFTKSEVWDSRIDAPELSILILDRMARMSCITSKASISRPTTTSFVDSKNQPNQTLLQYKRSPCMRSSMYLASGGSINLNWDSYVSRPAMLDDFYRVLGRSNCWPYRCNCMFLGVYHRHKEKHTKTI